MGKYDHAWKLEAKCFKDEFIQEQLKQVRNGLGYDPFFPPKGADPGKWAKSYCSDCPVRLACLAEAMKSLSQPQIEHYHGIWGGLTVHGRTSLRRKQQRQVQLLLGLNLEQSPDNDVPNAS